MSKLNLAPLVSDIFEQYAAGKSVDASWSAFFEGTSASRLTEGPMDTRKLDAYRASLILGRVIENYRWRGHTAADLDPLGLSEIQDDGELQLDLAALSLGDGAAVIDMNGELRLSSASVVTILERLRAIYCGSIGYEYMHLDDPVAREWLRREIEDVESDNTSVTRRLGARRLIEADEFEKFTQKRFVGKKLFGAEGAESLLSLLGAILDESVELGVRRLVLGGTSRARISQLVNFVGKPAAAVFKEITDKGAADLDPTCSGDVPYHLGYRSTRLYGETSVEIEYCANPSHLEAVNTVAMGKVRALQDQMNDLDAARSRVMSLLVHTDAAFAGQGVVAEALQMGALHSYTTGGTVHVVINNQVGFTTAPSSGRSSRYCTDVAKGVGYPVFHVNANDVDAVLRVARLAAGYRARFRRDVVVDLVCYRAKGHNELDEPTFTQPRMYRQIEIQTSARRAYLDKLHAQNILSFEEEQAIAKAYNDHLEASYSASASYKQNDDLPAAGGGKSGGASSTPSLDTLKEIGALICSIPNGIEAHSKVERIFSERAECLATETGINWGFAEAFAIAATLRAGYSVRLSGQDTPRGAFSHRHYLVHDQKDERRASIFSEVPGQKRPSTITESLLAEYGPLGFEYGYSLEAETALVIWEAQFGDFANVAQPIFDQFIFSGEDKWQQRSRLVVLLPHGLEGQGSEHSSGRIERFLQMAARSNVTIANCSTPANYFHLLYRQAMHGATPLVIFTPKSLLRHKSAVSSLKEMAAPASFQPVICSDNLKKAQSIVLCSGKLYWELEAERHRAGKEDVCIARLEQLYPFPHEQVREILTTNPNADLIWCQEEPANMGAWSYVSPILREICLETGRANAAIAYVGRRNNPSPSIGSAAVHAVHQSHIIAQALGESA